MTQYLRLLLRAAIDFVSVSFEEFLTYYQAENNKFVSIIRSALSCQMHNDFLHTRVYGTCVEIVNVQCHEPINS